MLRSLKFLQSSKQPRHPSPFPHPRVQNNPNLPVSPIGKQYGRVSRRELSIGSNSLMLLLLGCQALEPVYPSKAEEEENPKESKEIVLQQTPLEPVDPSNAVVEENPTENKENDVQQAPQEPVYQSKVEVEENPAESKENDVRQAPRSASCSDDTPAKRAFLDISIDGEPVGRIMIGLYQNETPAGAARFSKLVSGAAGISYRRKEFVKIMPNYVQHGGVRSFGVDAELAKNTGSELAVDSLKEEWQRVTENCPGTKNLAGTISIIVRDPSKPPPKLKLVAREGKLEIDQEEVGTDPNGTEFVISTKNSPELDASTLVIGRVLQGMNVVERIGQVKTVQENTGSPYFRVAKLIGDKRAVVAERGFNRPYSKVIVTNCGLLE